MRPTAQKKTPAWTGVALVLTLLATGTSRAVAAENAPPSIRAEAEDALLYRGSLHFTEQGAESAQPKMRKMETMQKQALLQKETGPSTRLFHGGANHSAGRGFPPYSGASLFFFDDAIPFAPGALPFSQFRMILFRLFLISALTLVFSLPAMAIEMRTVHRRRKGRTWIASYPFKEGHRLPPARGGPLTMKRRYSG